MIYDFQTPPFETHIAANHFLPAFAVATVIPNYPDLRRVLQKRPYKYPYCTTDIMQQRIR